MVEDFLDRVKNSRAGPRRGAEPVSLAEAGGMSEPNGSQPDDEGPTRKETVMCDVPRTDSWAATATKTSGGAPTRHDESGTW